MYGYYRSGKKISGIREIIIVHIMKDEQNAYCEVPKRLTPSEFTLGKHICGGCMTLKKKIEKEQRKKEQAKKMAEFTASMF